MPRPPDTTGKDPTVPVHWDRLAWAIARQGIPVQRLADAMTAALKARAKRRPGSCQPRKVSRQELVMLRNGQRHRCRLSLLTELARELDVPGDWLRSDRQRDTLPVDVRIPGERGRVRLQVNRFGWPAQGYGWSAPGRALSDARATAGLWTDLHFWRETLVEGYDPREWDEPSTGAEAVEFLEAMARAYTIALAPLDTERGREHGLRVRPGSHWRLLGLVNPELAAAMLGPSGGRVGGRTSVKVGETPRNPKGQAAPRSGRKSRTDKR